jgi:hypothetical protein
MLGGKGVYIHDHTLGRSGKVMEGKGEEKRYLPETGDNCRKSENRSCQRMSESAEGFPEVAERSSESVEVSEVSVGVELQHVGGLE